MIIFTRNNCINFELHEYKINFPSLRFIWGGGGNFKFTNFKKNCYTFDFTKLHQLVWSPLIILNTEHKLSDLHKICNCIRYVYTYHVTVILIAR